VVVVSIKDKGKCEKVLTIKVAKKEIQSEYDRYYTQAGKKAKIPGFRPGRAPKEVVAMHFQSEAKEEVLRNLVQQGTTDALESKKITPLYYPAISKVNFTDDELSFDATIELRPEVKLGKCKGLTASRKEPKVSEDELTQAIDRMRESYARFVPVENRGVQEHDQLMCDLEWQVEGGKSQAKKDDWFEVDPAKAHKDLVKGVLGMKPDETRVIEVQFEKDFGAKEIAGKKVKFTLHLKEIKKKELPELTDEWIKELGESQTVADFKKRVEGDLLQHKKQQEEHRFEDELVNALLQGSKLDLPEGAIERRLHAMIDAASKQQNLKNLPDQEKEKQEKALHEKLRPEAEKQLRIAFVFEALAKSENLKLEEKDLNEHFQKMADQSKVPLEKVKTYYNESNEKRENLEYQILNQKVLDYLKQHANVQTK